MKIHKILVINLGSTSTKLAFFKDAELVIEEDVMHSAKELAAFEKIRDQYQFRKNAVLEWMKKKSINLKELSAVVSRGAPLKPLPGGTYLINEQMVDDLKHLRVQSPHITVVSGVIAYELAKEAGIPAYIADPISVDEMIPEAKISGFPAIKRHSLWHALNCKAEARRAAAELGGKYEDFNFVVTHLGGGITVSAHEKGKAIDTSDANSEGPFSPERAGTVPIISLVELCFSGCCTKEEIIKILTSKSGLMGYLGTHDAKKVEDRIKRGDGEAELVYKAMAYQIAKEIGAMAAALKGKVDAIIITGNLAHSKMLTDWIVESVSFISKILIYPGAKEMEALAHAAMRVLKGEEEVKEYD